jgi:hypothetical protein
MKKAYIASIATIAAIALLYLPGCASRKEAPDPAAVQEQIAEHRAQEIDLVRSTVLEDDRADRIVALLDKRDGLISGHVKEIVVYRKAISALNADYDAQRESFNELISRYNSQRETAQREIVALIADMKKETTSDEWKVISRFQLKRLNPRQIVYNQTLEGV